MGAEAWVTANASCSANIQNGEGVPTILLEHGFINGNYNLLNTDEKLKKIAEAASMLYKYCTKVK